MQLRFLLKNNLSRALKLFLIPSVSIGALNQSFANETVDQFQISTKPIHSRPNAMARTKADILFTVGFSEDDASVRNWIVRKSLDKGLTWSTADRFVSHPTATTGNAKATDIEILNDQQKETIAVSGTSCRSDNTCSMLVRISDDLGVTWTVSDDYSQITKTTSTALSQLPTGELLHLGSYIDPQNPNRLLGLIRISDRNGKNWTTLKEFTDDIGTGFSPYQVATNSKGQIFWTGVHNEAGKQPTVAYLAIQSRAHRLAKIDCLYERRFCIWIRHRSRCT